MSAWEVEFDQAFVCVCLLPKCVCVRAAREPSPAPPLPPFERRRKTPKPKKKAAIAGADLVLHTAGPFQRSTNFNVIEAAIAQRTPYIDVCDDTTY